VHIHLFLYCPFLMCGLCLLSFLENIRNFPGQHWSYLKSNWQKKFLHLFSPRIMSLQHVPLSSIGQSL